MKPLRHFRFVKFSFLVLLLLAACKPSGVATLSPQDEEDETAEMALTSGSLGALNSYRLILEFTTRWEAEGQTFEEKETFIQEASRSPQEILHIKHILKNNETGIIPVSTDSYRLGLLAFSSEQQDDRDVCRVYDLEQSPLIEEGVIDPQAFFAEVNRRGPEDRGQVVNDLVTDRFSASGLELPLDVVEEETVQLWVAQKGGYIVRFTVEAQGQLAKDGKNVPASLHWEFNLTDVDQELHIALSPDCQQQKGLLDSLPIPSSAEEMQIMGNSISFSAPETTQVTADFIRQGMQDNDWKSIMDLEDDTEEMYMLQYQQGDRYVDVLIGKPENGGAFVTFSQRP